MNNIISAILIVSGIGLFFGYTNSIWRGETGSANFKDKSVKELQIEKIRYEDALRQAREIEEIRNGLLTRYNSIDEEDRKRIVKFLPDHVDSVRLIIDINSVASAYGMSMDSIRLSETTSSEPAPRRDEVGFVEIVPLKRYDTKRLDFSLSGPYENFIAFLKDIEKSLRLVDIVSVDVSAGDQSESAGEYGYTVSLQTYYLKLN